jgi:tetratricopeptide (TPR) repeat protein
LRDVPLDSVKARVQPAINAPPLIAYRAGICVGADTMALRRVRLAVPAFHEAAYFLAVPATFAAEETGGDAARSLLEQAYGRFAHAPGVTLMFGWLGTVTGDCASAVRYYDEAIAIEPAHEHAWLQRTICLTHLRQDSAAIASATRLIELETQSTTDGYYWRALNRLRRKELELARSDIELAKARSSLGNVLTLAGMIEHDQDDLPVAERDLRAALKEVRSEENCTASWYLGLVLTKGKRWPESAASFEEAMGCYDRKVVALQRRIARIRSRPTRNAAFTARRIAQIEADTVEQRVRYHASAYNAAGNHSNGGNVARARELLDVAARDPKLAAQVSTLRQMLSSKE